MLIPLFKPTNIVARHNYFPTAPPLYPSHFHADKNHHITPLSPSLCVFIVCS